MNKYPPGPWQYRPGKHDDWGVVKSKDGYPVVQACIGRWTSDFDKHRTNGTDPGEAVARLISAAPELLAVVEAFLRAPSAGSSGPGSVNITVQDFNMTAARAAIAKATGEKS